MWMMVSRPLVIVFGLVVAAGSGLVAAMLPPATPASDTLMYVIFFIMACEGMMGVACIVVGVWSPIHRWLADHPARR